MERPMKVVLEAKRPEYNGEWRVRSDRFFYQNGAERQRAAAEAALNGWREIEPHTAFRLVEVAI